MFPRKLEKPDEDTKINKIKFEITFFAFDRFFIKTVCFEHCT